jgi:hypothetical protein
MASFARGLFLLPEGAGDRTKLRDKVLRELQTPILFVHGTRDPVCPLDLLEEVRSQIKAPNFLHLVEDGDHSLQLTKRELQAGGKRRKMSIKGSWPRSASSCTKTSLDRGSYFRSLQKSDRRRMVDFAC